MSEEKKKTEEEKQSREELTEEKDEASKEEKQDKAAEKKGTEGDEKEENTEGEETDGPEKEAAGPQDRPISERFSDWTPKTKLGKDVLAGKYDSIDDILKHGELILEPEIVDALIPDLMQEVIYIGGSPGKGGGIRRTATKMTARMHKSGRRFKLSALAVVGDGKGVVGIGRAISNEHRVSIEKAVKNAKLSVVRVKRGCGSWECGCDGSHSVPFKVTGTSGSVKVSLLPAPKGVGMVASEEVKKILRIAGIKDVWVKTSGKTETRANLATALFNAIKNLNSGKGEL